MSKRSEGATDAILSPAKPAGGRPSARSPRRFSCPALPYRGFIVAIAAAAAAFTSEMPDGRTVTAATRDYWEPMAGTLQAATGPSADSTHRQVGRAGGRAARSALLPSLVSGRPSRRGGCSVCGDEGMGVWRGEGARSQRAVSMLNLPVTVRGGGEDGGIMWRWRSGRSRTQSPTPERRSIRVPPRPYTTHG